MASFCGISERILNVTLHGNVLRLRRKERAAREDGEKGKEKICLIGY
jgi:hypothetical protein